MHLLDQIKHGVVKAHYVKGEFGRHRIPLIFADFQISLFAFLQPAVRHARVL